MNFKTLNLINPIVRAATETGYSRPTDMQSMAIPQILLGKDIMGFAEKGKEKLAAFTMPVLQLLKKNNPDHNEVRALILTSSGDSAIQIEENFKIYSKYLPLSQLSVFEGILNGTHLAALRKRLDVLIITPGKLLELDQVRYIDLSKVEILVLDETEMMMEKISQADLKKIIGKLPQKRQNIMFAGKMSDEIKKMASAILNNPLEVTAVRKPSVIQDT
ncbi:DEAD/DEAH box helicase [Chryseobacterium sp. GMJ5]|uniref:DEAD/DEAH box helicase n=1 Tax=Chryseobacterium gilvum TaxID=2976534 RepID=A0ABT2VWS3_9FLAO|nr:DEAD/DEAH box helicase [Chryseobacterium gilvum]MCU7614078.1 DEAD/DEAH box helicase [Chryseobacterium gilvum]